MVVLIPAYEPDDELVRLVGSILATPDGPRVVVVDDGSGSRYDPVFAAVRTLGAEVLAHLPNRGKGFALRRGFAHVAERHPGHDVVCADCDGQHSIVDILRVAAAVRGRRRAIVLGARRFVGDVPARSRFGNDVTRLVFRLATGIRLQDTQTGLRGYPADLLPWLATVKGDRFEYELEVLLAAKRTGLEFHEVPIETIYLAGNRSSHFRPVRDSIRVYVPFVRFGLSSLAAFTVDAALFFALMATTGRLVVSVVAARAVSATMNYLTNRRLVFGVNGTPVARSARRYGTLVLALMAANYGLLRLLTDHLAVGLVGAKALTETTLFLVSYEAQKRHVFASPPVAPPRGDGRVEPARAGARADELAA